MEHLILMFLDHTQRRSTVGRTPLDELQAREFKRGWRVNKWSDVEWTDVIYVKLIYFEVKWSELRWSSWRQKYHVR